MKIRTLSNILLLLTLVCGFAASISGQTETAAGSGNWNSTTANAPWPGGQVPLAGTNVVIPSGDLVTNTASVSANPASITIQSGGALIMTGGPMTVTNFTLNAGGTFSPGSQSITFAGSVTNNGTYNAQTSSGTTTLSGTSQTISGSSTMACYTLAVSGIYTNNGTVTAANGFSGSGTLIQGINANLTDGLNNGGAPSISLVATNSGNTVTYSGSGPAVKVTTYYNITFSYPSSGSSYSWSSSIVVNGTLTAAGSAGSQINNVQGTFGAIVQDGAAITCNAATTVSGNLTVTLGTLYAQTGLLTVDGTTTINGGQLTLGSSGGALFTGNYTLSSGTNNAYQNNSPMTFGGSLTVSGGTFTVGSSSTNTFSGSAQTISGTISMSKVTMSGTYTNAGALTVTNALMGSGTLTQGASSTLNLGGPVSSSLTLNCTANPPNLVNYFGAAGQTNLATTYINLAESGTNQITGNVTVNSNLTINAGSDTLTITNSGALNSSSYAGPISDAGKLIYAGSSSQTLSGIISGAGSLTNAGPGTLILSGTNTFTGYASIGPAGVVQVGAPDTGTNGPLGVGTNILFRVGSFGGKLQYTSANNYDYSTRFTNAANQYFSIDENGQNVTFGTNPPGSSAYLTLSDTAGGGSLTLNAAGPANTLSLGMTINSGATLIIGGAGYLQSSTSASQYAGAITNNGTLIHTSSAAQIFTNGIMSGTGGVIQNGGGTWTLSPAETYSGNTVITSGTLALGTSIANSPLISIAAGSTLDVSAISSYALSANNTLSASGMGTTVGTSAAAINGKSGGTVSLDSRPVVLNFTPSSTNGDTTHPALYISQGSLTINGQITLTNNYSQPLGPGTYYLISQASGTITGTPTLNPAIAGQGLAAGCSAAVSVSGANVILSVGIPPAIVGGISPASTTLCAGSQLILSLTNATGTAPFTYQWETNYQGSYATIAGATNSSYTNPAITPAYTNFECIVANAVGSTTSAVATVTVNPLPTVTIAPSSTNICTGGSATLTANTSASNPSYLWSDSETTPFITVSPASTTSYSVTVTDGTTGCANTSASATVTVNPLPTVTISPSSPTICSNSPVGLTASGASTYGWSPSTGLSATTGDSVTANPATTTTYTVTGTNASGCVNMATVTVTINPLPAVTGQPSSSTNCVGDTASFTVTTSDASDLYQWFTNGVALTDGATGNGSTIAGSTNATLNYTNVQAADAVTNIYCVLTATNGCTISTTNVSLTVNPLPVVTGQPSSSTNCVGDTASFTVSTSDVSDLYQWFTNGVALTNGATGNGSTIGGATNATLAYTNVQAADAVTNIYCVLSTPNGCSTTTTNVSLTVNPLPTAYSVTGGGSYCTGGLGVDVQLSSSDSGVNYQLFAGATPVGPAMAGNSGQAIDFGDQTTAGTYTVVATSVSTACTASMSGSATVTVNPLPVVTSQPSNSTNCVGDTASFTVSTSDVSDLYQWFTNGVALTDGTTGNGSTIAGSATATLNYTNVQVADAVTNLYCVLSTTNGCTISTTNVSLTVNPLPTAYSVTGGGSYCAGGSGVDVQLSSSDSGVNYQLYAGATPVGPAMAGNSGQAIDFGDQTTAGTYTVVATSVSTACTASMSGSATVTVNPLPTVSVNSASVCAGSAATLTATTSANSPSYLWSDSETTASITVTPAATTNYTVTVTDGTTGCANSGSGTVTVNALPTTSAIIGTNSVSAGEAGVTYSVALTSGSSYAWTVPGGATITAGTTGPNNNQITVTFGSASGNVGVTETNSSGCTGTPQTLAVTVTPTLLTVTLTGNTLTINWGGTQILQSAGNVSGPWTPVTTNTGPYTINVTTQPQQFYRCVAP